MAKPAFSPADIAKMRGQIEAGTFSPQAWAKARGVSVETVRRAARGDSYARLAEARTALVDEPDREAISRSLKRLAETAPAPAGAPPADDLLADLLAKGKDAL